MANEPEVIRQQMEETRTGLQAKLETLEQQVKDTVQGATEAVSETVETVKETVKDTVETVKETVEETVESVKDTFNLAKHVEEHPWAAFACATVCGFVGTRLVLRYLPDGDRPSPPALTYVPRPAVASAPTTPPVPKRSWWSWIADHYRDELHKLQGLAVGTAGGIVREMLTEKLQPELRQHVKEVIDGFTTKLGGQLIEGPILTPAAPAPAPPVKEKKPEDYTPRTGRFQGTSLR
jgi:ElaB/YqjD/DUF883 family membrane-anchored ribosome-binding protein